MKHFHGTSAKLSAGEVLVPGERIGVSIHGVSGHVFAAVAFEDEQIAAAIDLARYYAGEAADAHCTEHKTVHYGHFTGELPTCMHIYEVEPGSISGYDQTDDPDVLAAWMDSATIIAEI